MRELIQKVANRALDAILDEFVYCQPAAIWRNFDRLPKGVSQTALDVVQRTKDAVVSIAVNKSGRSGFGSGVVVSQDGFVLTNAHIVDGAERNSIAIHTTEPKKYRADLVDVSDSIDAAILRIDGFNSQTFKSSFTIDQSQARPGTRSISFGLLPAGPSGIARRTTEIISDKFHFASFERTLQKLDHSDAHSNGRDSRFLPKARYIVGDFPQMRGSGFSGGPVFHSEKPVMVGLHSWSSPGSRSGIVGANDLIEFAKRTVNL
jgi:hypothetical protein